MADDLIERLNRIPEMPLWETDWYDHDAPYQPIEIREVGTRRGFTKLWQDDAPVPEFNAQQGARADLIALAPEMKARILADADTIARLRAAVEVEIVWHEGEAKRALSAADRLPADDQVKEVAALLGEADAHASAAARLRRVINPETANG